MLLILAVLATSMITPMSLDAETDSNWPVCVAGRVAWEDNIEAHAVVTVNHPDGWVIDQVEVWNSGDYYSVPCGYESDFSQGDRFQVSCALIYGSAPYPVQQQTLVWQDDFIFTMPYKVWRGLATFVF